MRISLTIAGLVALIAAAAACSRDRDRGTHREQDRPRIGISEPQRAPDNTGKNERDRSGQTVTAGSQKENPSDLKITRQIRVAIVEDKTLSVDADNVKIVTADGVVTLRGPVRSETEKRAIERKARTTAGVVRVDNQLEVEHQKSNQGER